MIIQTWGLDNPAGLPKDRRWHSSLSPDWVAETPHQTSFETWLEDWHYTFAACHGNHWSGEATAPGPRPRGCCWPKPAWHWRSGLACGQHTSWCWHDSSSGREKSSQHLSWAFFRRKDKIPRDRWASKAESIVFLEERRRVLIFDDTNTWLLCCRAKHAHTCSKRSSSEVKDGSWRHGFRMFGPIYQIGFQDHRQLLPERYWPRARLAPWIYRRKQHIRGARLWGSGLAKWAECMCFCCWICLPIFVEIGFEDAWRASRKEKWRLEILCRFSARLWSWMQPLAWFCGREKASLLTESCVYVCLLQSQWRGWMETTLIPWSFWRRLARILFKSRRRKIFVMNYTFFG